jgi:hypothetical protein
MKDDGRVWTGVAILAAAASVSVVELLLLGLPKGSSLRTIQIPIKVGDRVRILPGVLFAVGVVGAVGVVSKVEPDPSGQLWHLVPAYDSIMKRHTEHWYKIEEIELA